MPKKAVIYFQKVWICGRSVLIGNGGHHDPSSVSSDTREPQAILQAWMPFKKQVGVTTVRTEADYRQALATIEVLLEEVGDDETHPLAEVLDYLSDKVKTYEDEHFLIPKAKPHEVLRFLMDQHQLKQEDLAGCTPQSRISNILNGNRAISKEVAKRLARRFHVPVGLFL